MPVTYVVKEGDSVTQLAFQFGFLPDTIWDYPANADLKQLRVDMDILMPGDVLTIPDKTIANMPAQTDMLHKYVLKGTPAIFRLQVFADEEPRKNQNYTLAVDGKRYKGTTDDQGVLEEKISPAAVQGELTIGPDNFVIEIGFGTLDPLKEVAGIQKRLSNLDFYSDEITGEMDEATHDALSAFQRRFGLPETGAPDAGTLSKLQEQNDRISEFPPLVET